MDYKLFFYYYYYFSSENSEMIIRPIQNIFYKNEECGSDDTVDTAMPTVNKEIIDIPYEKKQISEMYASLSNISPDSSSSNSNTDNSSGNYN